MVKDLSEIFNAIKTLAKDASKVAIIKPKRSISKSAMDATAYFPVAAEDSLTPDEDMMICRSLEKRFATFLITVMQLNPTFDRTKVPDVADYIKQWHQNMDTPVNPLSGTDYAGTVTNFLGLGESLGVEYDTFVSEAIIVLEKVYQGINSRNINMESAKLNFTIESVANDTILNDIGRVVLEAKGNKPKPNGGENDDESTNGKDSGKITDFKQREPLVDQKRFEKANDVVPTLLHIRVIPDNEKYKQDPIDFVIGVKAVLHPVKQTDMLLNLVRGLKNEDKFFNFLRWTTGEIKFFKDFLFGIDQMKLDSVTSSSSSNVLFSMGRRRKSLSVIKNYFSNDNLLPNMTIVVTTDCLSRLRDEYGYDIGMNAGTSQVAMIKKLMSTYFLISFVIVDPGLGRVNMIFDGQSQFENYTYSNLQKEGTVNDKQFKEMMRMLGRSV